MGYTQYRIASCILWLVKIVSDVFVSLCRGDNVQLLQNDRRVSDTFEVFIRDEDCLLSALDFVKYVQSRFAS